MGALETTRTTGMETTRNISGKQASLLAKQRTSQGPSQICMGRLKQQNENNLVRFKQANSNVEISVWSKNGAKLNGTPKSKRALKRKPFTERSNRHEG